MTSSAPLKLRPYGTIQMCILLLLLFKFWEVSDDILEMVQDRDIVARGD